MANKNKHVEHHNADLLENPEAIADQFSRSEAFVENNKTLVMIVGGILILLVGGIFAYSSYKDTQEEKAQADMFQATYYFESDSLDMALNGDGNTLGFVDIADEYGMTKAANLANFYAGVAYLKKGEFDQAISYLEEFSSDDLLIQARAFALMGDAYMELGAYGDAAEHYEMAANEKANKYFTPTYLMKAALAHEKQNNAEAAIEAYTLIIDKYWESAEFSNAKKYRARLRKS